MHAKTAAGNGGINPYLARFAWRKAQSHPYPPRVGISDRTGRMVAKPYNPETDLRHQARYNDPLNITHNGAFMRTLGRVLFDLTPGMKLGLKNWDEWGARLAIAMPEGEQLQSVFSGNCTGSVSPGKKKVAAALAGGKLVVFFAGSENDFFGGELNITRNWVGIEKSPSVQACVPVIKISGSFKPAQMALADMFLYSQSILNLRRFLESADGCRKTEALGGILLAPFIAQANPWVEYLSNRDKRSHGALQLAFLLEEALAPGRKYKDASTERLLAIGDVLLEISRKLRQQAHGEGRREFAFLRFSDMGDETGGQGTKSFDVRRLRLLFDEGGNLEKVLGREIGVLGKGGWQRVEKGAESLGLVQLLEPLAEEMAK